jgi:glycosyltransferase involved in cell wall biosynthesis
MVVSNLLDFGGLEEFAKSLAIGIQQYGHNVSVISTAWVPPNNQYLLKLRENNVTFIQLPKWLSLAVSDWSTKEKILVITLGLSAPLILLLGCGLFLLRRKTFKQSIVSAHNWLRGQLMSRIIGPDRRKPFVNLLLAWWRIHWRPDLIHIHGYTSTLLFILDWAYSKNIPVIYEEHQTPDAQFDWWKDFQKSINKATMVIGVSEKSAQALRDVCGVVRPTVVAYYMVADPADSGWEEVKEPEKFDHPIRVTTVARLYVTKGLTFLLEAIARVKIVHPTTQFEVYGDGPLREELLAYAEKLGLDGKEIFVGAFTNREELPLIMAKTDIYVMSSVLEGLPIALLEAMAYGRAIVTTPVGGIREVIEDGVNGILCEPRDPDCLARKICSLIEDPALRLELGHAARKTYMKGPFSPSSVCDHYVSIYQQAQSLLRNAETDTSNSSPRTSSL